MAEKVKFRLTAAKVGVSAALLALIGGVVETFRPGRPEVHITPASAPGKFLKLGGISGNVRTALIKLEDKWIKLDTTVLNVVDKLAADYLKINKANTEFLKIQKATSEFLKIQKADSEFLKIQKADAEFLKVQAARNEFVQGRGGVVSAATPALADGSVTKLLTSPDGSLVVTLTTNSDMIEIQIDNTTGLLLPAVQEVDDQGPVTMDLQPGPNNFIRLVGPLNAHHVQLQTFGDGSSNTAQTLVLSSEQSPANQSEPQVVAQMLIGLL